MHLEGKLHTGYLKIRKVLAELKQKREEYRRMNEKMGKRRSRSRSLSGGRGTAQKKGQAPKNGDENGELYFYYSSKKLGTGANVPETDMRLANLALEANANMGYNVSIQSTEQLGKEWGYYKRNIDKARREQQNEQKKQERERDGGGFRRNDDYGDRRGGYDRSQGRPGAYGDRGNQDRNAGYQRRDNGQDTRRDGSHRSGDQKRR